MYNKLLELGYGLSIVQIERGRNSVRDGRMLDSA